MTEPLDETGRATRYRYLASAEVSICLPQAGGGAGADAEGAARRPALHAGHRRRPVRFDGPRVGARGTGAGRLRRRHRRPRRARPQVGDAQRPAGVSAVRRADAHGRAHRPRGRRGRPAAGHRRPRRRPPPPQSGRSLRPGGPFDAIDSLLAHHLTVPVFLDEFYLRWITFGTRSRLLFW